MRSVKVLLETGLEPFLKAPFMCGSGSPGDNRCMGISIHPRLSVRHRAWQATCRLALVAAVCWAAVVPLSHAGGKDDHERARAAVQAGKVLPPPVVPERLQRTHPGQVLELELELDNDRWVYEIRLMQADGQLLKLELDAATAEVLKVRRK